MNELSLFSNFCNCKAKKKGENLTPPPLKKNKQQNKTKHKKKTTKTNKQTKKTKKTKINRKHE